MRYIFIEPLEQSIGEFDHNFRENLDALLGGFAVNHAFISHMMDDHDAWVDEYGTVEQKIVWHFRGIKMWGPMIICGKQLTAARLPLDMVRPWVAWG